MRVPFGGDVAQARAPRSVCLRKLMATPKAIRTCIVDMSNIKKFQSRHDRRQPNIHTHILIYVGTCEHIHLSRRCPYLAIGACNDSGLRLRVK